MRETLQDRLGRVRLADILVGIGGKEVEDTADLYRALEDYTVGDTVKLKLAKVSKGRVEAYREVEVRLGEQGDRARGADNTAEGYVAQRR